MKILNINSNVRVKLTPEGIRTMEEYYYYELPENLKKKSKELMPKVDEEGFCEMTLLEIIWIFGSCNFINEAPFDFDIQIDEKSFEC